MLNASIVLYNSSVDQVRTVCASLLEAACIKNIYLIDNSPVETVLDMDQGVFADKKIQYLWNEGRNLGYGRAHNIALRESVWQKTKYHLVLNPDIELRGEDIDKLYAFMEHNGTVGCLMPRVVYPNGKLQYLCKLLPTPIDMLMRRFMPKRWGRKRNARYEMRHSNYDKMMNVPALSGCFMFLRTRAALEARLFDERYFMYAEDVDLTRMIHRNWLTLYIPDITIVHFHARGSYKDLQLLWTHCVNMCRYFNKWGWWRDRERDMVNRLAETQFETLEEDDGKD